MMCEGSFVYTDFFVDRRFEGYKNVVHGGMIFGVLDSILWYVILLETKKMAMTRKVEMEFFKPIVCNTHYKAQGKFIKIDGKDIHVSAWVEDENGEAYARVNAIFREGKKIDLQVVANRMELDTATPEMKEFFLSLARKD
jgi:acyl-coenzyme A thioesterase PaaI-like protein